MEYQQGDAVVTAQEKAREILQDFMMSKAQLAEMHLLISQRDHIVEDQRKQIESLTTLVNQFQHVTASTQDQKKIEERLQMKLTEALERNHSLAATVEDQKQHINTLTVSMDTALTRAKNEEERIRVSLETQLAESREACLQLRQRLIARSTADSPSSPITTSNNTIYQDEVTLPEGVTQRLFSKFPISTLRSNYNVEVELRGRCLMLRGPKLSCLALKNDVLTLLLEQTATGVRSSFLESTGGQRALSEDSDTEHLRRSYHTAQNTISSLHVAIQLANDRVTTTEREKEDLRRQMGELQALNTQLSKEITLHKQQIEVVDKRLEQQAKEYQVVIDTMRCHADGERKSANETRTNVTSLESEITALKKEKEALLRAKYVAEEEVKVVKEVTASLIKEGSANGNVNTALVEELRTQVSTLQKTLDTKEKEWANERGQYCHRVALEAAMYAASQQELSDLRMKQDQWQEERKVAQNLIAELSSRVTSQARGEGAPGERQKLLSQYSKLEEELVKTRNELRCALDESGFLSRTVNELKERISQLTAELSRAHVERAQTQETIRSMEVEHMRITAELQGEIMQLRLTVESQDESIRYQKSRAEHLSHQLSRRIVPSGGGMNGGSGEESPSSQSSSNKITRLVSPVGLGNSSGNKPMF
eukprot:PhF_6_TR39686/c0_g1_i3/m.58989